MVHSSALEMSNMQQVYGYVERITFSNDETGFTIAKIQEPKQEGLTCVVGKLPGLQPGETIRCTGSWKTHMVHGKQFEVDHFTIEAPADLAGIEKYLGSGLISGIGPTYAKRIVDTFGVSTLEIIDSDPTRLKEVNGLGKKRISAIIGCWAEQRAIRSVMIFLQTNGVSPTYAQKIFKVYGSKSIDKVKENPYRLAKEIIGIGFKMADKIAQKMGITKTADARIDAGIDFVLNELSGEGHTCYPLAEFLPAAAEILDVETSLVETRAQILGTEEKIVIDTILFEGTEQPFVWGQKLYRSEKGIAHELRRLKNASTAIRKVDTEKAVEWAEKQLNIELAPNQKMAVEAALKDKIHVITGGPGTGKSTITNAILSISAKLTQSICLAAPTGRAAKRMSEITGRKAQTIHSLLEVDFRAGGFKRGRDNPLECDLIIIDEASMIDTSLMYSLLRGIPDCARVIFVGDINQLPSVGPGNVLKDLIASHAASVTTLREIFRQAAGSQIITNAHRINKGEFPDVRMQSDSDFFFIEALEPEEVRENILSLVTKRLPNKYGFDPVDDIQVLAPMKKGVVGIDNLNTVLQEVLNKRPGSQLPAGRKIVVKDKVMQIRNNYQLGVYNGDIGRVKTIDAINQQVTITYDERDVIYAFNQLDEVVLAYAVSIHKYQGSECPCVVIPVHTTHFKLLCRNLLYTGVTRGKKIVVLVGTKKALFIAVNNDDVKRRFTGLQQAICDITLGKPMLL